MEAPRQAASSDRSSVSVTLAPRSVVQVLWFVAPLITLFACTGWALTYPLLALPALACAVWAAILAGTLHTARTEVAVTGDTIHLARRWGRSRFVMPRLRQGWVHPFSGGYRACVVVRGGYVISLAFPDPESARGFLAPLLGTSVVSDRLPLAWSKSRLGVASALTSLGVVLAAATVGVLATVVSFPIVQFAWLAALPVLAAARARSHVTLGHDGLLITVLGSSRFVRYEQIVGVEAVRSTVLQLELKDGTRQRLALEPWGTLGTVNATLAADWIERCIEWARRGPSAGEGASFARNGRSIADWRRALRAMFRGTYRSASATPEIAEEIVCDARNGASARIGAALALSESGAVDRGENLRMATQTCANPRLRVALEQVLDGEIDERLLSEIEDEARLQTEQRRAIMGEWHRPESTRE